MKFKAVTTVLSVVLAIVVLLALVLMNYGSRTHPQAKVIAEQQPMQTIKPTPTIQSPAAERTKLPLKPQQTTVLLTPAQQQQAKQPENIENVCSIFTQYPVWYTDTKQSAQKWGVPIHVQMATMYQESKFVANAKPPFKEYLWGIIPLHRQSSAVGFCQALNNSWKDFQKQTGNCGSRTNFAAATDFIGWYGNMVHRYFGIPSQNAYAFYLAYHEGPGGYLHRSYLHKIWLVHIAFHVRKRAQMYQTQLGVCRDHLEQLEKVQPVTAFGNVIPEFTAS
jgi:hypothetical protein